MEKTQVVVLGGGYAGLAFIQGLRQARVSNLEITLVDRNPYHTLLTETHTVAAGTRAPGLVELPFTALGAGVRVVQASVQDVDTQARTVMTDAGPLTYDYLVFGLGGTDNDFGTPGVQDHALFLRGRVDAERIRGRVESLPDGAGIVVVGGGLTGVELAAEMALRFGGRRRITVVEAAPSLLPALPVSLQQRARRRLGWLGCNVMTGARITAVAEDQVHLADGGVLSASLVVWAAGVKGHPLVAEMGADVDRGGRAIVDAMLRSSLPDVYVLGDSAAFAPVPGQPPLPPSAQVAEQMGFSAAADLVDRLRGGAGVPFTPQLRGVLCDLGGLNAVGLVYRFQVHGRTGALAKRFSAWSHLWRSLGMRGFLLHTLDQMREWVLPTPFREPGQ